MARLQGNKGLLQTIASNTYTTVSAIGSMDVSLTTPKSDATVWQDTTRAQVTGTPEWSASGRWIAKSDTTNLDGMLLLVSSAGTPVDIRLFPYTTATANANGAMTGGVGANTYWRGECYIDGGASIAGDGAMSGSITLVAASSMTLNANSSWS